MRRITFLLTAAVCYVLGVWSATESTGPNWWVALAACPPVSSSRGFKREHWRTSRQCHPELNFSS